jgi:hypothetical protein
MTRVAWGIGVAFWLIIWWTTQPVRRIVNHRQRHSKKKVMAFTDAIGSFWLFGWRERDPTQLFDCRGASNEQLHLHGLIQDMEFDRPLPCWIGSIPGALEAFRKQRDAIRFRWDCLDFEQTPQSQFGV